MDNKGNAAIWARVSTRDKQEPSLESQVAEVKPWLESQGWTVPPERVISVEWTSKNLLPCPEIQNLLRWVKDHEVGAVGALHLDRFAAKPGHMAQIIDVIKDAGVELLLKLTPLPAGLIGDLVALVITIGKALQVDRAGEGSRDGLHKRALLRGLPTTCGAPYGYRWDESRTRLLATSDWENRALILRLFMNGSSIGAVKRELHERSIPTSKGREWWPEATIWNVLVDTVNYGEYRALRREQVEPKQRRGRRDGKPTYGKTSSRKLPGIPLSNITVEKPILTKEEYEWILKRLEQNRLNSKRNADRDYLFKGLIHYEVDNRRYHGRTIRDRLWSYEYPDNGQLKVGHPRPYINGPRLEAAIETMIQKLLASDAVLGHELGLRHSLVKESISSLEDELRRLSRQENANTNAESELVGLRIRGKVSDEAYDRQMVQIAAERKWITEETTRVQRELSKLKADSTALVSLEQLRNQVARRLESRQFADRRFVLEALSTRIVVTAEGRVEVEFGIPREITKDAIALNVPRSACL